MSYKTFQQCALLLTIVQIWRGAGGLPGVGCAQDLPRYLFHRYECYNHLYNMG